MHSYFFMLYELIRYEYLNAMKAPSKRFTIIRFNPQDQSACRTLSSLFHRRSTLFTFTIFHHIYLSSITSLSTIHSKIIIIINNPLIRIQYLYFSNFLYPFSPFYVNFTKLSFLLNFEGIHLMAIIPLHYWNQCSVKNRMTQ